MHHFPVAAYLRKLSLLFLFAVLAQPLFAQTTPTDWQAKYANGRELFSMGKYDLAMQALREVTQAAPGNIYAAHASFYYAMAAFRAGQGELARNMWMQVKEKFPDWKQNDEVDFWLGYLAFTDGNLMEGYRVLERMGRGPLKSELSKVKDYYLMQETNVAKLQQLFELHSSDEQLALHLADCIVAQPMVQQNQELLDFLISDFNLDPGVYNRITPEQSVMKERYRVAVLLPFLHDRLRPGAIPDFWGGLLNMYEGMRMAQAHLDSLGMPIELLAYDTQRDSATTAKILAMEEMQGVDLIIGPLFPQPLDLVREFSETNRIVMFNPMSTNSAVIGSNPFAFLIQPSQETKARKVAEYAASMDTDSVAYIFYGTRSQDSTYAFAYQAEMLARGFAVPLMMKVDEEKAQASFEALTRTFRYSELKQQDSARAAEELQAFLRRKQRDPNLRLEKEEFLIIPPDSIGHVLVASDNGLIAASVVGAIETRAAEGDSITVYGSEEWLLQDFQYLNYEQLERLGVIMTAPTYFDRNSPQANQFQEQYIRRQHLLPGREVFAGYDMLMLLGSMLHQHGTYFQFGMRQAGLIPGAFFLGFDYRGANDNQLVPLIRFREFQFEVIEESKN